MIRPPVENVGRRQPIAFELPAKILRHHSALHPAIGNVQVTRPSRQACKLRNLFIFKATSSIQTRLLTKQPVRTVRLRYAYDRQ